MSKVEGLKSKVEGLRSKDFINDEFSTPPDLSPKES